MSVAAMYRIPMTFNARLGPSYMQAVILYKPCVVEAMAERVCAIIYSNDPLIQCRLNSHPSITPPPQDTLRRPSNISAASTSARARWGLASSMLTSTEGCLVLVLGVEVV
jgi:hypothetical protein